MPSPASPSIAAIRTLALVGPAAAGKTSLAECLLHRAGMIGAVGSLERGSTVSDHDPLERRMQHSLGASIGRAGPPPDSFRLLASTRAVLRQSPCRQ